MKDSEFIELLNLYLDHEISAADAVRLEAEVVSNPARRKTYQEYCRMQKACKMLAEEFQTDAAPEADRKVVAFEIERPARRSVYLAGAMVAAAACLAVIFGLRNRVPSAATTSPVVVKSLPPASGKETNVVIATTVPPTDREISRTVTVPAALEEPPVRLVTALALTGTPNANQKSLLNGKEVPAQFAWIQNTQLAPVPRVPIDQFRFNASPSMRPDSRIYATPMNATEMNALRYQK
jgi:hypothetical protein